jgi:hypothetical protein
VDGGSGRFSLNPKMALSLIAECHYKRDGESAGPINEIANFWAKSQQIAEQK